MYPQSQKQKIKIFFKETFNRELCDAEIEEIHLSLFFLGRAIHRYHLIKNGLISPKDNDTVIATANRGAQASDLPEKK